MPRDFLNVRRVAGLVLLFGALMGCEPPSKPERDAGSPTPLPSATPAAVLPSPPADLPNSAATSNSRLEPRKVEAGLPDASRVEEIAALLSPQPKGLGEPIMNRAAWQEAFPNREAVITAAENALKEEIPVITDDLYLSYSKTGSRSEYDPPYRGRTKRLAELVLGECVENKGRFLPAIEDQLAAILKERTWTLPYHDRNLESFNGKPIVDLGASMRAWNLATVDYVLGDKLKPETRTEIRSQVKRRVLDVYRAQLEGKFEGSREWWPRVDHNWNAVCHAGVIGSALALLPAAKDRAWYVAAMEMYIPNYLSGFTPDGYCSEGIGYWNYGFGHYVLMAEAVGQATGWQVDLLAPPIVGNILTFPRRLEILPGVYPSFSDNSPSVRPSSWIVPLSERRRTGEGIAVTGLANHGLGAMFYETMALAFPPGPKPSQPNASQAALPLRDSFPDAGIVVSRSKAPEAAKGFGVAFKGGHNNEHHNHNDVGSYVLALNGKALLVDPGMEVYTARTFGPRRYESKVLNSYGHDVPVVAGKLQDKGAEARGTLSVLETSDVSDSYLLDFTKAYAQSAPSLKKLTRRLTFVRSPRPALEVVDEAEFASPQSFETALITFGKSKLEAPDKLVIYDGADAIRVQVAGSGTFSLHEEALNENLPSGKKPNRIGVRLNEPAAKVSISYRIEPGASPSQRLPVVDKSAGESRGPQWAGMIRQEAEAVASEAGGKVELATKVAATGGNAIRMWNRDGHALSWKFRVPKAGNYGVLLRYCNGESSEALRSLTVDGLPADGVRGGFAFPATGGWSSDRDDWKEVWLAQSGRVYVVHLDAGEHLLALRNLQGGAITLDWIALVPLEK